jgi:hypothetical protein
MAKMNYSGSQATAALPQLQRPLIRSTTHAPDQPTCRPRLLHWTCDLSRPRLWSSVAKAGMIFMAFRELHRPRQFTGVFAELLLPAWEAGISCQSCRATSCSDSQEKQNKRLRNL